jgi:hypothetical protein
VVLVLVLVGVVVVVVVDVIVDVVLLVLVEVMVLVLVVVGVVVLDVIVEVDDVVGVVVLDVIVDVEDVVFVLLDDMHGLDAVSLPGGPVCAWFSSPQPHPGRVAAKPGPTVNAATKVAIMIAATPATSTSCLAHRRLDTRRRF